MAEERNPFSVGIPILLAAAAAVAAGKVWLHGADRPPSRDVADAEVLDCTPVAGSSVSAPRNAKVHGQVRCTPEDAAVVWFKWPESRVRLQSVYVSDRLGREYSCRIDRHIPGLLAVCIQKGYDFASPQMSVTVETWGARRRSWKFTGALLPASQPIIDPKTKADPAAIAFPERYNGQSGLRIRVKAASLEANAIQIRPVQTSYVALDPRQWTLLRRTDSSTYEGVVELPNAAFAKLVEFEVRELKLDTAYKDITFAKAGLKPVKVSGRKSYPDPERHPGPHNSIVELREVDTGAPVQRPMQGMRWMTPTIMIKGEPSADEKRLKHPMTARAEVLFPSASDLNIRSITCRTVVMAGDSFGGADPSISLPESPPVPKGRPGELIVRLGVRRPRLLAERKLVVALSQRPVVTGAPNPSMHLGRPLTAQ